MPRRSYAHYCAIARSLDVVGERWKLLIVRELLPGPRRYTELHADLPGISTDVLAARLKELEADGLLERSRSAPPTPAWLYGLTPRGRDLLPVLSALARWGSGLLDSKQATDALRGHWLFLPLAHLLADAVPAQPGVAELRVDGACCQVSLGPGSPVLADGGDTEPDAVLTLGTDTAADLASAQTTVGEALAAGRLAVSGESALAAALRAAGDPQAAGDRQAAGDQPASALATGGRPG